MKTVYHIHLTRLEEVETNIGSTLSKCIDDIEWPLALYLVIVKSKSLITAKFLGNFESFDSS